MLLLLIVESTVSVFVRLPPAVSYSSSRGQHPEPLVLQTLCLCSGCSGNNSSLCCIGTFPQSTSFPDPLPVLHTERGRSEEGADSQSSVCHEAGPVLQPGVFGLGLSAPNQSAAVLLLLWRPRRVRLTPRVGRVLSPRCCLTGVCVCVQVVPEDAAVLQVSAVVP